jgi:translation initiation factor 1
MSKGRIVWSDEDGDQRKKKDSVSNEEVIESNVELHIRRLTTGKGRTVIEISNLPNNKNWCKKLAKDCKKSLGVGGSYKDGVIEVHGEKYDVLSKLLDSLHLKHKKTGG